MKNTVSHLVSDGIKTQLGGKREINPGNLLKEDLGMSSIKMVMFLTNITNQLGINIMDFTDQELICLKSVGDITELLIDKLPSSNESR